jgi:hypothetical protein
VALRTTKWRSGLLSGAIQNLFGYGAATGRSQLLPLENAIYAPSGAGFLHIQSRNYQVNTEANPPEITAQVPNNTMTISTEAAVAIAALIVSLPPTLLILWSLTKRKNNTNLGSASKRTRSVANVFITPHFSRIFDQ